MSEFHEPIEDRIYRELGHMPGESLADVLNGRHHSFLHVWFGIPAPEHIFAPTSNDTRATCQLDLIGGEPLDEVLCDTSSMAYYLASSSPDSIAGA